MDANGAREPAGDAPITQMGYEDYPTSIGHVLQKAAKDYHGDLIVTENGIATSDDTRRCRFIQEAAAGVKEAMDSGVPVKGCLHWSLLDNFEWQAGYGKTFGIIAVDRDTQKRYPKAGPLGIIGNASTTVAGAARETTGILKGRGLPVLVMADGPAGLRLSREYTVDGKGNVQSLGEGIPESILEFLSPLQASALRLLSGKKSKKDAKVHEQYATAITRGVQRHPGCGTTIKHYVANNQEANRYNNSSRVSERAMREIYLKGFESCVKEARPYTLITSYNLLNGLHTSESRDLTEDILRCEWGFDGVVMTDWIVAAGILSRDALYPAPKASKIAAAGGNLVMPGNQGDWKDIVTAVREGRLRREQLEINATKVFEIADRLTK